MSCHVVEMLIMSLSERVESKLQEEFSPSHMVLRDNSKWDCKGCSMQPGLRRNVRSRDC